MRGEGTEPVVEFSKREDLKRWLDGKPREWAVVIAVRAALRVAPTLATTLGQRGGGVRNVGRDIILPTFHEMAVAWVGGTWPIHRADIRGPNFSNYPSILAYDRKNAVHVRAAAYAARAAGVSVDANMAATDAVDYAYVAARTADAIAIDIWSAVSADATALEIAEPMGLRPTDLAIQYLWPTGTPKWAKENWTKLRSALLAADEDWEVWTDWYEARLYGANAGYLPNAALEVARVTIEEEVWEQGPKVVNAYIKWLMEEHEKREEREIFQSAFEDENKIDASDNNLAPSIPAPRRAAVEPIWDKGRLTLPKKSAKLDLDKRKFTAALSALRSELRELADDVAAEANIDKRPAAFLRRLADRIPEKPPAQDELFRLGHAENVLAGFAKTVAEEWPDFLAKRYQALALQFDRTMRQSPLWREFKQNAAKETLSAEQISDSTSLAKEAANALREEEAAEFVDQAIPNSLEKLAEALSVTPSSDEPQLDIIAEGSELLAADLIESVNNVFKPIAEAALTAARDYGKGFGKGFKKAAKKQGPKDGEKAFKWLRHIVIGAAGGGVAGTGSFIALSNLIAKYPDAFEWLGRVLRYLN